MLLTDYNKIPVRKVVFCRRNLWRRDRRRCQYCGKEPPVDEITMDHIFPKSRGGESNFENCVLCCMECNHKKGNRSLSETGMRLRRLKRLPNGDWTTVFYDSPRTPQWNPLYALKRRTCPQSWAAFLKDFDESLYWEVELET
ncbi:MAG: HNH endonuclease [Promethearchaeota archaeon]